MSRRGHPYTWVVVKMMVITTKQRHTLFNHVDASSDILISVQPQLHVHDWIRCLQDLAKFKRRRWGGAGAPHLMSLRFPVMQCASFLREGGLDKNMRETDNHKESVDVGLQVTRFRHSRPQAATPRSTHSMIQNRHTSPFLGTLNNRCRTIFGTQKGTIVLTTNHMNLKVCELQRSRQLRV